MTKLEFYMGNAAKHIAVVDAEAVPREGEYINIRGETYQVSHVTWAVDHSDNTSDRRLRANIILLDASQ